MQIPSISSMLPALRRALFAATAVTAVAFAGASAQAQQPPINLRVFGGIGAVAQYQKLERPFWAEPIGQLSNGRITAEITPYDDGARIRPQELLQLMKRGAMPLGTVLLAGVQVEEPELAAVDHALISPTLDDLRETVRLYRPRIEKLLRERYDMELLGVYTYPAQAIFCRQPFTNLTDLKGRRVRVSSPAQGDVMTAVGATPVQIAFNEMVPEARAGRVDCLVTGTLSGNAVGLQDVTTHMGSGAITWGLSFFGANTRVWNGLPADVRDTLRTSVATLEKEIWDAVGRETEQGILCNGGRPGCELGKPANMTIVPPSEADRALRQRLLAETVLPQWIQRCGPDCVDAWNSTLAQRIGVRAKE